MNARFAFFGALAAAAVLAACGGGGGGGGGGIPTTMPSVTATPCPVSTTTVNLCSAGSTLTVPTNSSGVTGSVQFPSGSGTAALALSASPPASGPPQIATARRDANAVSTNTGVLYLTVSATTGSFTMNGVPGVSVTVPSSVTAGLAPGTQFFIAYYGQTSGQSPPAQAAAWVSSSQTPALLSSGGTLAIPATKSPTFTVATGSSITFVLYYGYYIPQINTYGCVGVQGDATQRTAARAQLVGVAPPTVGSTWAYSGTLTSSILDSAPCPVPTATANATVSISVSVTSPPAGTASGFVDEHSVEADAFTTNTTQVTTDALVNGTNELSATSTDVSGNTTVTTWGGNGLTYNSPNAYTNGPPTTVNSTFADGSTYDRTYTGTSGAYTETDTLPGASGTATVNADGSAAYNVPNITVSGGLTPNFTMSAPTGGSITFAVGSTTLPLQAWFTVPMYTNSTTVTANQPISSSCTGSALGGTSGTESVTTINDADPALGTTENETISAWFVPNYNGSETVGPVCVLIKDTQNLFYDFQLNTTSILLSPNAQPLQTSTYNEVYSFASAPTGEARVRAASIGAWAAGFAYQHSGIAFARSLERMRRLQQLIRAAASGRIKGVVR